MTEPRDPRPAHIGVSVRCVVCGREKVPHGRSLPPYYSDSRCRQKWVGEHGGCDGYGTEPLPGCAFPGEVIETPEVFCENATRPMTDVEIARWESDHAAD